jgi:hypothetical protein
MPPNPRFDELIRRASVGLLLTMTRNKVAEKLRRQHRQRGDSRRTVGRVEELALAGRNPSPSSVVAAKELLESGFGFSTGQSNVRHARRSF